MLTLHVPRYAAPIGLVLALSATPELAHGQSMGPSLRTVAVVGSKQITDSDLAAAAGNKFLAIETQLHRARQAVLDNLVTDALLALASKERGLSVEQLVRLEIEQKARPVGVEEVKAVLDSARERLGATSEIDAMNSIRSSMQQSRIAARRLDYVNELRRRFNVEYPSAAAPSRNSGHRLASQRLRDRAGAHHSVFGLRMSVLRSARRRYEGIGRSFRQAGSTRVQAFPVAIPQVGTQSLGSGSVCQRTRPILGDA